MPTLRFVRRTLCALVASLSLACGPVEFSRPDPVPARVWEIDSRTLHNSYRDHSTRWTNQTVRVTLPVGSYKVSGRELHWHGERDTDPPDIVFECATAPGVSATGLEVVAVVVGRVEDGQRRTTGAKFHVRLKATGVVSR